MDGAVAVLQVDPPKEDLVDTVEDRLRAATLVNAKEAMTQLASLLEGPPGGAARALHLMGETAAVYGEMLAAIGIPGTPMQRRRGVVGAYAAGSIGGMANVDFSPGGETFGNQALQQIVATAKQVMQNRKIPSVGEEIEHLTHALGEAKRSELDEETITKIKQKLDAALAADTFSPPLSPSETPKAADEEE